MDTETASKSTAEIESEDVGEIQIPSIVESIPPEKISQFQPFYKRYFEERYCTKHTSPKYNLDTCIRVHTNKICVVFLSAKHSIVAGGHRIKRLNFQISTKVNRLQNVMSGKGKRGAQLLTPDSVLCFILADDDVEYPIYAGIYGKLLEINDAVLENPNLLIDDLCEGFLAIILPDMERHQENLKSLKTKDEYNT